MIAISVRQTYCDDMSVAYVRQLERFDVSHYVPPMQPK
jgi:hypothetical protein